MKIKRNINSVERDIYCQHDIKRKDLERLDNEGYGIDDDSISHIQFSVGVFGGRKKVTSLLRITLNHYTKKDLLYFGKDGKELVKSLDIENIDDFSKVIGKNVQRIYGEGKNIGICIQ